jgi:multidrug efflux pump subunit AcrB
MANLSVALKNKDDLKSFIPSLQQSLSPLSGKAVFTVTNQNISGDDSQIKITLTGAYQQTLETDAQLVCSKLANIVGLSVEGKTDLTAGVPKYTVTLNWDKINQSGVNLDDINKILSRYMGKAKDFDIPTSKGNIPVHVYLDPVHNGGSDISGVNDSKDVLAALAAESLTTNHGQPIYFDQLDEIHPSTASSTIQEGTESPSLSLPPRSSQTMSVRFPER